MSRKKQNLNLDLQKYKLYEELLSRTNSGVEIDVKLLCSTIANIRILPESQAKEHYDEIYHLILHHDLRINKISSLTPFESSLNKGDKGLIFLLEKFPKELIQILALYIEDNSE